MTSDEMIYDIIIQDFSWEINGFSENIVGFDVGVGYGVGEKGKEQGGSDPGITSMKIIVKYHKIS